MKTFYVPSTTLDTSHMLLYFILFWKVYCFIKTKRQINKSWQTWSVKYSTNTKKSKNDLQSIYYLF